MNRLRLFVFAMALLAPHVARAQLPGLTAPAGGSAAAQAADASVSPVSPRATVEEFLRLTEAGDWAEASRYLSLAPAERAQGEQLARRLRTVLDQRLAVDVRVISPAATGDTTDGELNTDRLGVITGPGGREDAVVLSRVLSRNANGTPRWLFAPSTVSSINSWYDNLGSPWLRDRLPPSLMREGPLNIYLWQWIGIGVAALVLALATWLVSMLARTVLARLAARTTNTWDDQLLEYLRGPFRLWVSALLAEPLLAMLSLNARVAGFVDAATRGLVLLALFWALLRLIRMGQRRMETSSWASGHAQARTLVPLLSNILRVTLGIAAVLVALAQFGYPVGTLLAGLGIGGIAVALAAQKTVEHLFGSVSLAADRAFRVGDWVRAGGTEGEVQRIGLRSTSFRTNDRTVVRIPNGRLADERIETFGERDRMLFRTDLDLTYDTSPETLNRVRDDVRATLSAHPKIWPDVVRVHVVAFTDSAIRLNVMSWFLITDYGEFLEARHQLFLEFMRIVERHGSSFAFPSRTIYHVAKDGEPPAVPRDVA